jgi:hypothetical protein
MEPGVVSQAVPDVMKPATKVEMYFLQGPWDGEKIKKAETRSRSPLGRRKKFSL